MKNFGSISSIFLIFLMAGIVSCGWPTNLDSPYDEKIDSILSLMTLEEKIGQMSALTSTWDVSGPTMRTEYIEYIRSGLLGGIFNAHTASFTRDLQRIAVEETRLGIPLLFGYDVIHGHKTIFPIPLGEAASWDLEAIEKSARISAVEAASSGLHLTFAPMVDIARDPRWGRIAEGAGEDPFLGAAIAKARIKGFQGNDLSDTLTILACAKHFAAYGAAQAGRDYHTVDISDRTLREIYLPPFKAAVENDVSTIMTAFNELDGIPASGNKYLLTDILRNEWGFKGVVVSDYTSINEMVQHGVAEDLKQAASLSVNAGMEMDLQGLVFHNHLAELVREGEVDIHIINQAVKNILSLKYKLGLMDDPYKYCNEDLEKKLLYHPEHLKWSKEMARKSIVLLKNENELLPLTGKEKIAVIGPLADSKRDLLGSWKAAGDWSRVTSILEAIKLSAGNNTQVLYARGCDINSEQRSGFAGALNVARQADVVILVTGESWDMSGEAASRSNINLPGVQTELVREIKRTGKPLVMVLLGGRPLVLTEENELVNALLMVWFPGTEGAHAVADILFGKYNPSGKLPVTFPRTLGQVPVYYNVKNTGRPISEDKYTSKYLDVPNTPLFAFGYGLSYTNFQYGEPVLSQTTLSEGGEIVLKVNVKNTGKYDGEEIVQLYTRQMVASVTRPVLELKGFKKIFLPAGSDTDVSFEIHHGLLSFYRKDLSYGTEPGIIKVFVGGSSDKLLETQFRLLE